MSGPRSRREYDSLKQGEVIGPVLDIVVFNLLKIVMDDPALKRLLVQCGGRWKCIDWSYFDCEL